MTMSVKESHIPALSYIRFHSVLGFELREEFVGRDGFAKNIDLALDCGEVARREHVELLQALALLVAEARRVTAKRLDDEHPLALLRRQRLEADLEGEAAQSRFVELVEEVGRADEDAGVALHALQHL